MTIIYPLGLDNQDRAVLVADGCVGWRTRAAPLPDCALCAVGCCMQRWTIDGSVAEPWLVHGTAGSA